MKSLAQRDSDICDAYRAGRSIKDICANWHTDLPNQKARGRGRPLSENRVRQILHENRIELREIDRVMPLPKGYPKDPLRRDDEIAELHKRGCSMGTIGKGYGITRQRVMAICHDVARGKRTLRPRIRNNPNAVAAPDNPDRIISSYRASLERRAKVMRDIGDDGKKQAVERELCRRDPARFVNNWGWTFDPRRVSDNEPAWLPFDLFPRQVEMLGFIKERLQASEDGLIEKSRDIGFTWIMAAFAGHRWLFEPGFQTRIGSHLEKQVDELGNMDSIFEKIRQFMYRLPRWMMPKSFVSTDHDNFLRIINPDNGNTIAGGAGDEIGRGGRATLLFLDEAAFIERADRIDASTSGTTNCRIWASSVNGMGNLFARKRHTGVLRADQIFRFHWSDDPRKTQQWADRKKQELSATPWAWASEYEIDYSASVEGVCIPGTWVEAAVRLGKLLDHKPVASTGKAGLDVGGGKAQSVYICRRGPVVERPEVWGNPDTTETAYRGLEYAQRDAVICLNFDSVGIGRGVLSTLTRANAKGVEIVGINTGTPPSMTMWDDEQSSRQKFGNLKAEIWWIMRERFRLTWEHVNFLEGKDEDAVEHPIEDCIILPEVAIELRTQLSLPKVFRNERGRLVMESKTQLASRGIASPDQADALALTFVPGDEPIPILAPFILDGPVEDRWAPNW